MDILIAIVAFIVLVGTLVCIHELGHFFASRKSGVGVDEFGFGFPPRLLAWKGKKTLYSLNAIPLGGFVRIKGVAGDDSQAIQHASAHDSFTQKSFTKRFFILFSGIGMNIILTWVLLTSVYLMGFGESVDGQPLTTNLARGHVQITGVMPDQPAAAAGVQTGDVLFSVNGTRVESVPEAQEYIRAAQGTAQLEIETDGKIRTLTIEPIILEDTQLQGIGVGLGMKYPAWTAVWIGLRESVKLIWLIFVGLGQLLVGIFSQGSVGEGVVGPVGIAVISGQAVSLGVVYAIYFAALLSANLAIFNLLPLPALDGGRIVFLLIERIKGSPVNQKTESIVHAICFAMLLGLALLVTVRDVIHIT